MHRRSQQRPAEPGQIRAKRQRFGGIHARVQASAAYKGGVWYRRPYLANAFGGRYSPIRECFRCRTAHQIRAAEFFNLTPGGSSRSSYINKGHANLTQALGCHSIDPPAYFLHTDGKRQLPTHSLYLLYQALKGRIALRLEHLLQTVQVQHQHIRFSNIYGPLAILYAESIIKLHRTQICSNRNAWRLAPNRKGRSQLLPLNSCAYRANSHSPASSFCCFGQSDIDSACKLASSGHRADQKRRSKRCPEKRRL
ncbi:hypothetical protein D3C73_970280 [compost metagenome]